MAEEPKDEVTAPNIQSREILEAWLKDKPREVAIAIAARAALRVVPLVAVDIPSTSDVETRKHFLNLMAVVLRATALVRVVGGYATKIEKLGMVSRAEATMETLVSVDVLRFHPSTKFFVEGTFGILRTLGRDFESFAASAIRDTVYAAANSPFAPAAPTSMPVEDAADFAAAAAWEAVSCDAGFIARDGGELYRLSKHARALAHKEPLWLAGTPDEAKYNWSRLRDALPPEDNWQVWIDWYDRRLKGIADSEEIEFVYATVPESDWDKGPAAANAWIKARLEEIEKDIRSVTGAAQFHDGIDAEIVRRPPPPLENVPSVFTYGVNAAGQIDIKAGPQNLPLITHTGDEATHRRWLDAARKLAERLAADLRAQKFNAGPQYRERLEQYVADIPSEQDDGNIVLADAEARALHSLFIAETSALNEGFAARLKAFLETHFALLAFYEDEMRRFHHAAEKGNLRAPFPREAVEKVDAIVLANTPTVFAPRVAEGLQETEREPPRIELEPEDVRAKVPIQPPAHPFGDADYEKARALGILGSRNALYRAVRDEVIKDPEKSLARISIAKDIYEAGKPMFEYLLKYFLES
ncbi:MAG: hypothetical protein FJX48_01225 [Alphaproteobacteria bacterium]|nr:hypothetical protein [Alphaproteobacteria bacterium]